MPTEACLAGSTQRVDVPFITIDKGSTSGVRQRAFSSITTEPEWQALWRAHEGLTAPPRPVPPVDFGTEMVLAVFAGEKASGGHAIEIVRVEATRSPAGVRVFYRETAPPADAMVIQSLIQPFHLARVKRVPGPVAFVPAMPR